MKKHCCKILLASTVCAILGLIGTSTALASPRYTVTNLGAVGATDSIAFGINDLGQVVGSWSGISEAYHKAFLWDAVNGMNVLEGSNAYARDINNLGQICGNIGGYAAIWQNDDLTMIGGLGGHGYGNAINDEGVVVGYSPITPDPSSPYHAWVWDSENGIVDIDTTGQSFAYDINEYGIVALGVGTHHNGAIWQNGELTMIGSSAQAINDLGQIVGLAYLWDDGETTFLGFLDGKDYSYARDINNSGQIVGSSGEFGGFNERAFLWENGTLYDLNDLVDVNPDFILSDAFGINESGPIVGAGKTGEFRQAVVLTPIPEVPTIDDILQFFDESVEDGTLEGCGGGCLGEFRLWLMREMLVIAETFIEQDNLGKVCSMLQRVYKRCDGEPNPPDLVTGEAAPRLAGMIDDLRTSLGCE